ncbi:ricin-type beta-trefoil lectin domain protein [Dactylosporangium salmoneum]|uniref:ricin-type beta-trefoil lectin domain protein n=1 Tax=Dactylosporangium salmoneum TaxID=53361 RepID=UPI0031D68816
MAGLTVAPTTASAAPAPAKAPQAPTTPATPPQADERAAAAAKARLSNQPVELTSVTTPTERTVVNPDGTLTTELNAQPARTRRAGAWVPLDATLLRNADGSYSPAASANPLTISGGGAAALASMTSGDSQVALSWPGALPTPEVSGATATYHDVLRGVDLVVTATEQGGFSHTLVVHDAAAAADPALAKLRMPVTTRQATVRPDSAGGISVVDSHGRTVYTAPAPQLWDSTAPLTSLAAAPAARDSAGDPAASSAHEAGYAAKRGSVGVQVSSDAITLTPAPEILRGTGVRYPVYVDPSWNPNSTSSTRNAWTYANSYYATQSYFNSSDYARAGYTAFESPYYKARSWFQFPIPTNLWGASIITATLQTHSVWSANNSAYWFGVYHTCGISSGTTWNSQPCTGGRIDHRQLPGNWRSDGSYNPMEHDFDVTGEIAAAASGRWSADTIGLFNDTETDKYGWRKFQNNPSIAVTYNSVPNTPGSAATSPAVPCYTGTGTLGQIGNTAITFSANISDPDGTQTLLDAQFSIQDLTAGTTLASPTVTVSNNHLATVTLTASQFVDGHTYGWNVKATDGRDTSPATPTCQFKVNKQQPASPGVASTTYPADTTGPPIGTAATFTFTPPAGTDQPISFVYSLNTAPPATIPGQYGPFPGGTLVQAATTGSTSVSITPRHFGPNILYVYGINGAGNAGPVTAYRFTTSAPAQPAVWGDFTGDGIADQIAVGTAFRPGAWLYPGTDKAGHLGAPVQIGAGGTGGAGSTSSATDWIGAIGSATEFTGDGVQDLLVKLPASDSDGNVTVLPGTGDGSAFDALRRIRVMLPKVDGSAGNQTVDQVVASPLPSVTGSPLPDLYVVVGDNLYLYTPGFPPGNFEEPILISSGWTGRTIAAAVNGANPALFARTDATGKLELYTGNMAAGTPAGTTAPVVYATSGFDAASAPVLTGADINADGKPDLWADTHGTALNARINTGSNTLGAAVGNPMGNQGLLKSGVAGFCADNSHGANTTGNTTWGWTCNGGQLSQFWTMPGDGTIRIAGKCLDVTSSGTANGTLTWLWDCNGGVAQQWRPGANNSLINPNSNRCLDMAMPAGNGSALRIEDCTGAPQQSWTFTASDLGPIRSAFAGKCLDNNNGNLVSGNPIQLYDCNFGYNSQTWLVLGDGQLQMADFCVDVTGGGTANGTLVQLWQCNHGGAQQWTIGPNFALINPQSGKCLDVPNSNTANSTRLQIWECNGTNAQKWTVH